jgi:Base plate wedge protein 53
MTFRRSDQQRGGRFVQGGTIDVVGNRLGWWERVKFAKSPTDIPYVITAKYASRPDLLAFDLYGRPTLMWFIMQYNNISDVHVDFVEGLTIMLPTKSRVFGELLSKN